MLLLSYVFLLQYVFSIKHVDFMYKNNNKRKMGGWIVMVIEILYIVYLHRQGNLEKYIPINSMDCLK